MSDGSRRADRLLYFWTGFSATRMIIGATSALYLIERGLRPSDVIYLKSIQAFIILVLELPLGIFADRFGRGLTIAVGVLSATVWLGLTGGAISVGMVFVAEAFNAISLAALSGAIDAEYVEAWREGYPDRSLQDGFIRLAKWNFTGTALAALLGTFFFRTGSRIPWWIAFAAMIGLLIGSGAALRIRRTEKEPILGGPESASRQLLSATELRRVVRLVQHRPKNLVPALLASAVVGAGYQVVIQYWQTLVAVGHGVGGSAQFLSVCFFAILLVQSRTRMVSHMLTRNEYLYAAGLVVPLAVIVFVSRWTTNPFLLATLVAAYFWIVRGSGVDIDALINHAVTDDLRATVLSFESALVRVGVIVVGPAVAFGVGHLGPRGAFVVAGVVVLGAAAVVLVSDLVSEMRLSRLVKVSDEESV